MLSCTVTAKYFQVSVSLSIVSLSERNEIDETDGDRERVRENER